MAKLSEDQIDQMVRDKKLIRAASKPGPGWVRVSPENIATLEAVAKKFSQIDAEVAAIISAANALTEQNHKP